jgi:hypothetical protein
VCASVLVKGSRFMKMEQVVAALQNPAPQIAHSAVAPQTIQGSNPHVA